MGCLCVYRKRIPYYYRIRQASGFTTRSCQGSRKLAWSAPLSLKFFLSPSHPNYPTSASPTLCLPSPSLSPLSTKLSLSFSSPFLSPFLSLITFITPQNRTLQMVLGVNVPDSSVPPLEKSYEMSGRATMEQLPDDGITVRAFFYMGVFSIAIALLSSPSLSLYLRCYRSSLEPCMHTFSVNPSKTIIPPLSLIPPFHLLHTWKECHNSPTPFPPLSTHPNSNLD
jgi:hypothetical protein